MSFELEKLPYEMNALEPYLSKETLEYHYGKHHQSYVTNLNKLTENSEHANSSLEDLIKTASGGVYNNAAQIWNHSFYWNCLTPGGSKISAPLSQLITENFGSLEKFKEDFAKASATLFGSGWAFLVKTADGKLAIRQESNAGNPLRQNETPLLTCDVWEHAYYIDYRNLRPKYLENFWQLVNWNFVEKNLG
jgi:superoxide dismutase, Fe-Mn family